MNAETFENSPVFEKIEQFVTILESDSAKEKIDAENYSSLSSGVEFIKDRLKITIPSIVNDGDLNGLINELTNMIAQVNNYLGNNNVGHLNTAKTHVYTAVSKARNLPSPLSKGDFNFSKAISNFESTLNKKLAEVTKQKEELASHIDLLKNQLQEKGQEIEKISKLLVQKETEIQNLNSSFQTEYNNIKNTANQNYEQDRKTFRAEIDKDKTTFRNEIDNLKKSIDTDTTELVKSLNSKLDEAKKIVNVIGNVGATGNFQKIASSHKTAANTWRFIAIAFMTILSGLLIFTIYEMSDGDYDWKMSIIRIVAAAVLSYPATYAAQESSKHRKQENYNRRIELELASVDSFIELLDEPKKKEIKEKLVQKYFGNNHIIESSDDKKDVDIPVSAFEKIIKTLSGLINK